MRNFTSLFLLSFLLPGCSVYQYATLSANDMVQNGQKEFVSENDSLKIVYNFNGFNYLAGDEILSFEVFEFM